MKTNFELVRDFHFSFNKNPDPTFPTQIDNNNTILRGTLIKEEMFELFYEMNIYLDMNLDVKKDPNLLKKDVDLTKVAKELADLLYVVYGTAAAYGIPIDNVFREVHRSNMSKLGEDGKPIYREDGKVLKGPNYSPANIEKVFNDGK